MCEAQFPKVSKTLKVFKPRIGDPGALKVQVFEVMKGNKVLQCGIGDLSVP